MAIPGVGKRYGGEDSDYNIATAIPLPPVPNFWEGYLTTKSIEDVVGIPSPTNTIFLGQIFHNRPYPSMSGAPNGPPPPWISGVEETPTSALPAWTTWAVTGIVPSDSQSVTPWTSLSLSSETAGAAWPTTASYDSGSGSGSGPGPGPGSEGSTWSYGTTSAKNNNNGIYAAVAIAPIVVLAIIVAIVFLCMRRRKRQRREVEGTADVEEIKVCSPTTQAYMASPLGPTAQDVLSNTHLLPPPNPALTQPIILGPIPSGANGAYFTGIDTSDTVSMSSANHFRPPPNPFADNESLSEPPPPYRPRSIAPPSFTNSSRQSSVRVANPPAETSQIHLIERSPFDDPIDDDMISNLSGPTAGHSETAMSAVSDLSYQQDPVVNR